MVLLLGRPVFLNLLRNQHRLRVEHTGQLLDHPPSVCLAALQASKDIARQIAAMRSDGITGK